MGWQLAPQALSLPLRLASCTHPLLDGLTFHHADQPAFAFDSRPFRCCAWLHLPLPGPLKSLTVWLHGDCALRGITSRITGRGRRHGDQPLELRCPRSGACACWATPTYVHHLDAVEPLAIVTSKLQGDGASPSGLPPRLGGALYRLASWLAPLLTSPIVTKPHWRSWRSRSVALVISGAALVVMQVVRRDGNSRRSLFKVARSEARALA